MKTKELKEKIEIELRRIFSHQKLKARKMNRKKLEGAYIAVQDMKRQRLMLEHLARFHPASACNVEM